MTCPTGGGLFNYDPPGTGFGESMRALFGRIPGGMREFAAR